MRTVRRLRLRCLLFTSTPDVLSTLLLFALSNLVRPIINILSLLKVYQQADTQYVYGGPGGIRTRVQNTFYFASYDHKNLLFTSTFSINLSVFSHHFFPICTNFNSLNLLNDHFFFFFFVSGVSISNDCT